ncbi:ATP-binding protein [Agromyces archimandritae]|uniref:histidine kinase n=1 Tax=Agromyces archimandritae TaxID=2781962 RepID=A0A975FKY3_9MICO|nr:sensor histidine kinase [Agromyces archimandritae]QTX03776.1 sensor histidine kinase [Agromyces archimandritae]
MRKAMSLRMQMLLLQVVVVLVIVITAGLAALWMQSEQIREASRDRMIAVAQSVAQLPVVIDAYDDPDPAVTIQPLAELIRSASDVTYIVVTDADGVRFSHPNPDNIGEVASTPPDAVLTGDIYIGTQTGTLGESWRVKVPVHRDGEVIGQVSVGILESDIAEDFAGDATVLMLVLGAATLVAIVAAEGVTRLVRRRIYGLEPEDIRALLETRDAALHGIHEGLIAFDPQGRVSLCNDAAAALLAVDDPGSVVGSPVSSLADGGLVALVGETADTEPSPSAPQRIVLAGERALLARATPLRIRGEVAGTVVILMDRTEVDHALRQLAGAQSLAESLRAQQHEFANTLHTIGGLIDLGEADAARRVVERASDGGALTHATRDSGIGHPEVAALLLAKRARARELGVDLAVTPTSSLSDDVDGVDLVTVLGNLIDNALDAAGAHGRIEIDLEQTPDAVVIRVDDDGPGVAAADRDRVFDQGYSTKPGDRPRGYGLTLVARVASRRGGATTVADSPSGGARITARLPIVPTEVLR